MFAKDKATEALVIIGEIGGNAEEEAAAHINKKVTRSLWSASLLDAPHHRADAWDMLVRLSRAVRAPLRKS